MNFQPYRIILVKCRASVSLSLKNLGKCISSTRAMRNFRQNLHNSKGKVLQREDFDARKFRTIEKQFREYHPSKLVKETDIQVTTFRFEKTVDGGGEWLISSLGYLDTSQHWSWVRRFKWKGRVHIAVQFDLPFVRVLRYDYMFDVFWISMLVYLQILAFIIARKITDENKIEDVLHSHQ